MKLLLGACALLLPIVVAAQAPPKKVFRIGFLANTIPLADLVARVPSHPAANLIEEGLKRYGWVDGKNVEFVWRSAEGNLERLPELAGELVRHPVDVILTFGGGVDAAASATSTIPIVMVTMGNPVDGVRVKSLARPGGNITGMLLALGSDFDAKRLALLKEVAPKVSRVAWVRQLVGPPPTVDYFYPRTSGAAKALGLSLFYVNVRDPSRLDLAFEEAVREGADAMLFADFPYLYSARSQDAIAKLALRHRMPVVQQIVPQGDLGGVLAYASDISDNYKRAPYFIDRILRGARPGDLPIEQPSRFKLVVNLRIARALGLTIPASVLAQADRVIE